MNTLPKGTKVRVIDTTATLPRMAVVGQTYYVVCYFATGEYRLASRKVRGGWEGVIGIVPESAIETI
jgi:hypothetical protein